jgi:hypothetical protein
VVVELFTSEGCSSCPPADALLAKLSQQNPENGSDLIFLGKHVDYWNSLGRTDRFSSAQFSQGQEDYAKMFHLPSVYTPQIVIDGRMQLQGGDATAVNRDIVTTHKAPKPVQVPLQWEGNDRLHVTVQPASASRAKVRLAVTEDGMSTQVANGENGGKTLHHAAVVRELRELGSLNKASWRRPPTFRLTRTGASQRSKSPCSCRIREPAQFREPQRSLGNTELLDPICL